MNTRTTKHRNSQHAIYLVGAYTNFFMFSSNFLSAWN